MIVKQSYLSNIVIDLLGEQMYEKFMKYAIWIFLIGSVCIGVLFLLSMQFYNAIVNWFLSLFLGGSLLFIIYILAFILLLDKKVDVEVGNSNSYLSTTPEGQDSFEYKLTKYYGIFLIILGIVAIYLTGKYKERYAFKCSDCYIEKSRGIYHLFGECEEINWETAQKFKGYQIDVDNYKLCSSCEDLADEYKELESESHIRGH